MLVQRLVMKRKKLLNNQNNIGLYITKFGFSVTQANVSASLLTPPCVLLHCMLHTHVGLDLPEIVAASAKRLRVAC